MTEEFQHALLQVAKAIDGLTRVFEQRVAELRAMGESDELVREATGAISAVKDSGAIYLTWANHYAKRVASTGEDDLDDLEDAVMEE